MNYVFGIDSGVLMSTGVAIRSLDRFLSSGDRIVVLHLGLIPPQVEQLQSCADKAQISAIDCTGMVHPSWLPPSWVTEAAFLRNLAPDLLPDVDRCLYLDSDTVVLRDPAELSSIDLSEMTLGAVRSRVAPFFASAGGVKHWFEMGLPSTSPYFNSGVLLMNLDRWRHQGINDRINQYLTKYASTAWMADQEALNVALVDDWVPLDRSWNYISHVTESFLQQPEIEPSNPHIAHFAGRRKPWLHGPKPLFAEHWYQFLEQTPWAGFTPTPPPEPTRVQRLAKTSKEAVRRGLRRLEG